MQKAKEAFDELILYTHHLLYSHTYLKDVIFPIRSTLASTILAWSFMPRLLRRFHKYAMQSHGDLDDFDVQGCNGRTNHYGITVPYWLILSFVWFLHRWKSNVFTHMLAARSGY